MTPDLPFLPLPLPSDIAVKGAEETAPAERAASWAPGDAVRLRGRKGTVTGRIAHCNPKTAVVAGQDGTSWQASYDLLQPADAQTAQAREIRSARLAEISDRARTELHRHRLRDWNFAWDAAQQRGGVCDYTRRTIGLSASYALAIDDAEILDTLLHEIAHAMVGPRHGHGEVWARTARSIGCSARVRHDVTFSEPRWEGSCPNGCSQVRRLRRNRLVCRLCGEPIRWRGIDPALSPPSPGSGT